MLPEDSAPVLFPGINYQWQGLYVYAMGGYVLAKYKFPGRTLLFTLFTVTLLVPAHSKTQPIFNLIM